MQHEVLDVMPRAPAGAHELGFGRLVGRLHGFLVLAQVDQVVDQVIAGVEHGQRIQRAILGHLHGKARLCRGELIEVVLLDGH